MTHLFILAFPKCEMLILRFDFKFLLVFNSVLMLLFYIVILILFILF